MNMISREANEGWRGATCPLCRQPRTRATTAAFEPVAAEPAAGAAARFDFRSDEDYASMVSRITALNNPPVLAIRDLLLATLHKTASARIIIMSHKHGVSPIGAGTGVAEIQRDVTAAFPRTKFLEASGRRKVDVDKFNDKAADTHNIVCLMDIAQGSNSAQGLDLKGLDAVFVVGESRSDIRLQTMFRGIRMEVDAAKRAAPKLLVTFT